MGKFITFGEIMFRLNPEGYLRLVQADKLEVSVAGGEANVSVSLANYGLDTAFVSKVPTHEIGDIVIRGLRTYGIDTKYILRGGRRLGIYYVEKGASQRPSKVIYDREGSAIAEAKPEEFDWDTIFEGAEWFHWTGITPALSDNMVQTTLQALKKAKEKGVPVSCDLNYRKKLWTREKAGQVMAQLVPYVDVCIANEEDCADVFGIHAEGTDIESGKLDHQAYISVARQLAQKFGCKKVAITLRGSISASENDWAGMLYDAATDTASFSRTYNIKLIDRVGGGDSFGGGLIYALSQGYNDADAINFAVAASCLKQTIEHDFNQVKVDEVLALMNGSGSGRVQR